ncbi:signal peptidase I [Candidatus Woesearchaeota archaeon]|nr:signal peptidase I [Candidatus Woesearchaeota archaeon]
MPDPKNMGYFDRFSKPPYEGKTQLQKFWHFLWKEDSVESWILNLLLAFVVIKYMLYPVLGLILGTSYPIVAVVSGSMHHPASFDEYWQNTGTYYENIGITKEEFREFPLHNGFNKGDLIILRGTDAAKLDVGDVLVYQAGRPDPIIHRVIEKKDGIFVTKGDNYLTNPHPIQDSTMDEYNIRPEQIRGKAFIRVPVLGYVKIIAVKAVCLFGEYRFCIVE